MMMPELPEDLLVEILCRVPATSLKRLRSTCKRWNHLYNDKRFKSKHCHKAPRQSLILMWKNFGFSSISINLQRVSPIEVTGELNLIDHHSSLVNVEKINTRLVVWNPCTGKTKWIQHRRMGYICNYALGSYQDKKSGNNSYKILSHGIYGGQEFEIYEINSNSWRILDVTVDSSLYIENVSLKGMAERFERLCLPYQIPYFRNTSLSVVKEEKLSVLLQPSLTSKTQIWVTNKIGEAKVLSWIKFLTVDLKPEIKYGIKFLVDEENKVLVYEQNFVINGKNNMIYVVGEDSEVREVVFRVGLKPLLFYYVPSLTQIQQGND
ncbi:unnamed protein product [Arabidopsis thaliana]|uniref:F-box domain-containing protein n=1 Tax=Arabidopsis thaliana TaxID=3702 RepID=A0A654FAL2_ARATH|nr:unnamed protein product [Arabidopsis thaliana]